MASFNLYLTEEELALVVYCLDSVRVHCSQYDLNQKKLREDITTLIRKYELEDFR